MIPDHIPASIRDAEASIATSERAIAPLVEKRTALEQRRARIDDELATQTAARTEALYRSEDVGKVGARIRALTDEREAVTRAIEAVATEIRPLEDKLQETTVRRARTILLRQAWEAHEGAIAAQVAMASELRRVVDAFPSLLRAVRESVAALRSANANDRIEGDMQRPPGLDVFETAQQAVLAETIERIALHANPDWVGKHLVVAVR